MEKVAAEYRHTVERMLSVTGASVSGTAHEIRSQPSLSAIDPDSETALQHETG
jgi:hypothetical protein